jgi:hypothetical protein
MTPEEAFAEWRERPERSAAGAVSGLVAAWIVGASLLLAMVEPIPVRSDTAASGARFFLVMTGPLVTLTVLCAIARRVRQWAGYFMPGVAVGWFMGCLSLVLLSLLGAVA